MLNNITAFLAHLGITSLSLWVASFIFHGISFSDKKSLFVSALLLGMVNAVVRPVVIVLTIPLTLITFGFFLLVINALMMLLVSAIVPGFKVSGFWTAFFASIVVTLLSLFVGALLFPSEDPLLNMPPAQQGVMI
jgi:putative membrane protein